MSLLQFLKSKAFLKQIGLAILGLLAFIFILNWWLGFSTNHSQKIQVPDLQKMSLAEVQKKLTDLELDFIVIDSASFNPNYPIKSVIEQNPEAGDFVKEQRKIYLTLNPSRFRDVKIPELLGRTKRQVVTQLSAIGFKVGKFTFIPDLGKNVVRGFRFKGEKVNPGDKLPKNSVIDLVLGDGNGY
ncbi:PASTA domain-containing protein [Lutibacter sp. Hel_I_33_5]|uniref:PASTA domain-containing protein n=1 Tax=Lutibacter sp. Hel_I_33_5 TaxID=1566289 RepID=UPI0011A32B23|nr:PASTA domain-containing protein [Lutibacter sp. Hel_I_33_5]TVZ57076.1 PASTA domain-containing protein [Lutibacter sp. Hel_I_33_5]